MVKVKVKKHEYDIEYGTFSEPEPISMMLDDYHRWPKAINRAKVKVNKLVKLYWKDSNYHSISVVLNKKSRDSRIYPIWEICYKKRSIGSYFM